MINQISRDQKKKDKSESSERLRKVPTLKSAGPSATLKPNNLQTAKSFEKYAEEKLEQIHQNRMGF